MIEYLYPLAKSLDEKGLLVVKNHPDIHPPAKCKSLLCLLNCGEISKIVLCEPETTNGFWRHTKGNFFAFPCIKVKLALLSPVECEKITAEEWKNADSDEKRKLLLQLDYTNINECVTDLCMYPYTIKVFNDVLDCESDVLQVVSDLCNSFPQDEDEQIAFTYNIVNSVKEYIKDCDEKDIDFFKNLLMGKKDRQGKYISNTMLCFDMADCEHHVFSDEVKSAFISRLIELEAEGNKGVGKHRCSLTGKNEIIENYKSPVPTLPLIGNTFLYSNNKNIKCLERYNQIGMNSFKVGKEELQKINDALLWITQAEFKNRTWAAITGVGNGSPALLIVYVEEEIENGIELAQLFGYNSDYSENEKVYVDLCSDVCDKLKDIEQRNSSVNIKVIVIEGVDAGRTQVVLNADYTAEKIIEQATIWKNASNNHLELTDMCYIKSNKSDKAEKSEKNEQSNKDIERKPFVPYLNGICNFYKTYFKSDGTKLEKTVSGIFLNDIYTLFMPYSVYEVPPALINNILEYTLAAAYQIIPFFTLKCTIKDYKKLKPYNRYDMCMCLSLLSILLYYKKIYIEESNMENISVAYDFGQLCQLYDSLHKLYGTEVRNSVPQQLVGNTVIADRTSTPITMLNNISDRARVYIKWAITADNALAKWLYYKIQDVSDTITEKGLPKRFSPEDKALLFLGYTSKIRDNKEE